MSEWIQFTGTGTWVTCPLCGKEIRNLRMAMGSHIAWHQRRATSTPESGTKGDDDAE